MEKDRTSDLNHPEQWELATAPNRNTVLRGTGLGFPDDDLPPRPAAKDQPPPEVWCTVLERGHHYVVSAAASPGPQWVIRGTNNMLTPETTPPWAVGEPTTPHRIHRGVL